MFQNITKKIPIKRSYLENITRVFITDSHQSYRLLSIVLIIIFTSLVITLASTGAAHINMMPWDVMILLDGGWRIINGQTPHLDFHSPLGPLPLLLVAFGMKVAPPSTSSITYGNILFLLILTPWAWCIARSRLSSVNAFLFTLFIGFLVVSPRVLGFDYQFTSYAMLYNKQGFVLLSMLLIEVLIPLQTSARSKDWFKGGLSSGILLALLLLCKVNYFGIAILAILLSIILRPPSLKWLITFTGSFLLVCIIMQVIFNINLLLMLADIRSAGSVQSIPYRWNKLKGITLHNLPSIYLLLISFLIASNKNVLDQNQSHVHSQKTRVLIAITFVIFSGLLICATNAQNSDIPLFFIAGLIGIEYLRRELQLKQNSTNRISNLNYLWVILIIIPLFCGSILLEDIANVTYSTAWKQVKLPQVLESQRFQSRTLSDFIVPESANYPIGNENVSAAKDYPGVVNDGLALLRKYILSDSRVLAVNFSNPFPFALELPPPRGDLLWWHDGRTLNAQHFPDADQVFQNVDMLIIPKFSDPQRESNNEASALMKTIYGNYFNSHFIEQDSSQFWTLLVKR